jgi:von Willebrand factor type A domain
LTFLTPLAAIAALACLPPLLALLLGGRRVARVRRLLGLQPPARAHSRRRGAAAVAGVAVLALAATQPAWLHQQHRRVRPGVQALFVVDTSRSMAAATSATSPTRLDRAVAAAVRLRAAIPEVAAGLATFTDRVLPNLMPVPDVGAFDAVAERTVAIETPPPRGQSTRATDFAALGNIAAGDYFGAGARRRIVVLLTDGESVPADTPAIGRALRRNGGYRFLSIRFWQPHDLVYDTDGRPEPGYAPDPTSEASLHDLASALGGRTFEQSAVGAAATDIRGLAGHGRTVVSNATERRATTIAPYLAGLALILILAGTAPLPLRR